MRQGDSNYLSMAAATVNVLYTNQSIWAANTPVSTIIGHINEDLAAINTAQQGGGMVSTGATTDKEIAAETAIVQAVKLAGLAQVYAMDINNNTLHDQLKVSQSSFERLSDEKLTPALQNIFAAINALDTAVVPYGIPATELNQLQTDIVAFATIKSAPRVIIAERKGQNNNIPALLRDLRTSFYKLDRLIKIWADTNPAFVTNYQNARIIIDLGTRHNNPETPPVAPGETKSQ